MRHHSLRHHCAWIPFWSLPLVARLEASHCQQHRWVWYPRGKTPCGEDYSALLIRLAKRECFSSIFASNYQNATLQTNKQTIWVLPIAPFNFIRIVFLILLWIIFMGYFLCSDFLLFFHSPDSGSKPLPVWKACHPSLSPLYAATRRRSSEIGNRPQV